MINASNEFKELMEDRTDFKSYAEITFANGETLTLDASNFISGGNSMVDGSGSSSFPLGVAIEKYVKLEILNDEEQYKDYNFIGAKIRKYLDFRLSATTERIEKGTYTVVTPETYGETVIITAYDDMYKADKDYYTSLSFPQTASAVLRDICDTCDIVLGSTSFLHDDFIINDKPTGTFRTVIGYIAMIACGNARIDVRNRLQIISYDFNYASGNYHTLSNWTSPKIEYNDSVITGFKTVIQGDTSEEDVEMIAGTDEYMITIDNPLIAGREQTVLSWLLESIGNVPFRPFSGDLVSNPLIEFMDLVQLQDRRGNLYKSFVTDVNFVISGYTTVKNASPSMEKYTMSYLSESAKTETNLRGFVEKEKTNRELAIESLTKVIEESSGVFTTVESQADGSKIYYLHNKPTLDESDMVWKMTAEAWGVSTSKDAEGNFIWNAGMTVDGDTIVRILSAVGVNADWLNAGAITVKDSSGNIIFSVDMDTKNVIISGNSVRIGGKTATAAINDVLAESKDYADGKLADYANTVTKDIEVLQAQVDGQVETFYYDYEPSLQNIPASEWTTTAERQKHEGDLFFWKSKGYAYRFFQDGAAWKWQLVQDTDITQAMAAAEKAQDTADGKRRVFVVTPQPPYDIGDLWTNGTDILTCAVARAQGSVYVSSDWQKLNKYTDDSFAQQVQDNLDNLQIGDRNLVLNSYPNQTSAVYGFAVRKTIALEAGKTYILTANGRVIDGNGELRVFITNDSWSSSTNVGTKSKTDVTMQVTFKPTVSGVYNVVAYSFLSQNTVGGNVHINWYKLVKGTKSTTDWTPAPEDTESYADNLAADLQEQIDGKIQTYNQTSDPSTAWTTTELKTQHTGDLWYNPTTKETKRWSGTAWTKLENKEAEEAGELAQTKAQVFTTTPTVPYYVGDLWFNSATSDIMTCTTSRTTGSYTASDWSKRNKYTDDTVAKQALEAAGKAANLTIVLDNEYQGIPADYQGNITTFPTVQTGVTVYYGHENVSASCTYTVAKSTGVTGSWNGTTRIYTITALSTDTGWVDITATYASVFTVTKRFNVAKIKGGTPGEQGTQGINLLRYTKEISGHTDYIAYTSKGTVAVDPEGFTVLTIPADGNYNSIDFYFTDIPVSEIEGKQVVISAWVKSSGLKTFPGGFQISSGVFTSGNTRRRYLGLGNFNGSAYDTADYVDNEWARLICKATLPLVSSMVVSSSTEDYVKYGIQFFTNSNNSTYPLQIKKVKCEFGMSNDPVWTPAIEDLQGADGSSIKTFTTAYSATQSEINSWSTSGYYSGWSVNESTAGTKVGDTVLFQVTNTDKNGSVYVIATVTAINSDKRLTTTSVGLLDKGDAGRTYFMEPSTLIVKRGQDNSMAPNYITLSAYYRDGSETARTAYAGRFKIEESLDGATWTTVYTSSANESSVTHSLYSALATSAGGAISTASGKTIGIPRDVVALRCTLYAADGTTQMLDMQSVAVVVDVDALTHEEIFNLLTNNGAVKGIYQEGDQLYINATYLKSGEIVGLIIRGNEVIGGTIEGTTITGSVFNTQNSTGNEKISIQNGRMTFYATTATNIAGYIYPSTTTAPVGNYTYNFDTIVLQSATGAVLELYAGSNKVMQAIPERSGVVARAYFPLYVYVEKALEVKTDASIYGELYVAGTKSRIADTENYSRRLQYCYETPTPMFGDMGSGKTDENGVCYVEIDDIFSETVRTDIEYFVFLQKEGEGDLWIEAKESTYFAVRGTPNLPFAWEIKATQSQYETLRLDEYGLEYDTSENEELEQIYDQELSEYEREMEELYDE